MMLQDNNKFSTFAKEMCMLGTGIPSKYRNNSQVDASTGRGLPH